MIPQAIIDEYNLNTIVKHDGWCYAEIRKAMYGLQESAYLSNLELKRILAEEGYVPSKFTPGLFTHKTRDIAFSLVVDDFGIKYTKKEDTEHLAATIEKRYPMKCCWEPDFYLGITLEWDYSNRTVKMSILGYVKDALLKSQHVNKEVRCRESSPYTSPPSGKKMQMAKVDIT